MRRATLLLSALLVLPLLGSDSPKDYDGRAIQVDELQGAWRAVKRESDGKTMSLPPSIMTFQSGRWQQVAGKNSTTGTYTTDASRVPAQLDKAITGSVGKGSPAKMIYQIDGDTLRIAIRRDGSDRPKSFDEKGVSIYTWERVKK